MRSNLLLDITRCSEVTKCIQGINPHPCAKIILSQNTETTSDFQVPEPWSGNIGTAPILFISSNPSIGYDEIYPTGSWSDDNIVDFFQNRFSGGKQPWIADGTKSLRKDGSHGKWTKFWAGVKGRARELLEREPIPGVDYALTELVHCKSRQELGVPEALDKCVSVFLRNILEISGARTLIGLGSLAREVLTRELSLTPGVNIIGPLEIYGRKRIITFLPHPNAWQDTTFHKVLSEIEIKSLNTFISYRESIH